MLLVFLLISMIFNVAMFFVAFRLQSDKLTDISYAATFAALAGIAFAHSDGGIYHGIIFAIILIWAVRIGGFLLFRIAKSGKDRRFDGMRENFWKFGRFWVLQALTVWTLMIPSLMAFTAPGKLSLTVVFGLLLWAAGVLFESLADWQKMRFNSNPSNKGKWIDSGLWHYSRHPNYFGEILVWLGVYAVTLQSLSPALAAFGAISPLFISVLLLFVSGVPLLEKSADQKWGHLKEYREYRDKTSILIPVFRRKSS